MRNTFVIIERELRAYFTSPVAYAVLTIFALLSGVFFMIYLQNEMMRAMQIGMMSAQSGQAPPPLDTPGRVMGGFLSTTSVVFLFLIPMLTMALFSEEKRRGTMELLLTSPISDVQIVMGKFLSAFSFFTVLLASTGVHLAFLYIYGDPVAGPILTAYLGLLLFGMAIVAIGMFISSLTENQIVAGMISFGVFMGLWLFDNFSRGVENAQLKSFIDYFSIIGHLDDFLKGVLSTTHVIFYLSLTFFGLFLTYRSIDSMRWRG